MFLLRQFRGIQGLAALGAFALSSAMAGEPGGVHPAVQAARSLLRAGQIEQALDAAASAERTAPGRAETAVLLGEIHFRRADFAAAERSFRAALALDPACAPALLGLGRLEQARFRRKAARTRFEQAYAIMPAHPEVIRAYASVVTDPRRERELLREYLRVSAGEPRAQREEALGHLAFHQRLGERQLVVRESPYREYRLRAETWSPRPGIAAGVLLEVSINGSKPLRLVFDTGAAGIFLNARAGSRLDLEYLSDSGARGVGEDGPAAARRMLADRVRVGDLVLRNCPVEVTARAVTDQADGVIGASVFEEFLLVLDAQRHVLDLLPYPEGESAHESAEDAWAGYDREVGSGIEGGLVPVWRAGRLLLVDAQWNGDARGYLVLDTGASVSLLAGRSAGGVELALAGAGGLSRATRAGFVQFRIAGRDLVDPAVVSFDFRPVSYQEGVEISGLIGYPVLSRVLLTINYRDGLVGFDLEKARREGPLASRRPVPVRTALLP